MRRAAEEAELAAGELGDATAGDACLAEGDACGGQKSSSLSKIQYSDRTTEEFLIHRHDFAKLRIEILDRTTPSA